MASGFFALLDDIAALAKASAANLSDVPAHVVKTSGKVSGIVIDDTAVTPKYVVGLDPKRELIIIYKIARKSLINKLLILSPAALLLGYFAPWAITPILMLGGAYLCFEGYEKVHSMFSKHHEVDIKTDSIEIITPEELEQERVTGAVRTDIILSAEIIAHGIPFTSHLLHDLEHALAHVSALGWLVKALACAIGGLGLGFVVEKMVMLVKKVLRKKG